MSSVHYDMAVQKSELKLRNQPTTSESAQIVAILPQDEQVIATEQQTIDEEDWVHVESESGATGWAQQRNFRMVQDRSIKDTWKKVTDKVNSWANPDDASNATLTDVYRAFVNTGTATEKASARFLTNNMNNVLGLPYQFSRNVDRKLIGLNGVETVFGRKYAERIITNMPLLLLTPGKVSFMSEVNKNVKKRFTTEMFNNALGNDWSFGDSDLSQYLDKPTKYYTFEFDSEYYKYVDSILNSTAILLGIGDVSIDIAGSRISNIGGKGATLANFSWASAANPLTKNLGNSAINYVCLYVDAVNSKNESFSNDTTESQFYSKINSYSDMAKEIQFLLGTSASKSVNSLYNDIAEQARTSIDSIVESTSKGNSVFKDLVGRFSTIASGGKLLFPQIYSDSQFSQSYDVSLKLRCPNPTPLNWYLDIMVPLGYLYALVMPKSIGMGGSGYCSPFLVRGFYKSIFNIDLGIVTDLSVSKGKEGSWTADGLPTEVDVDLTIKDLYNVLYMSKKSGAGDWKDFVTNDQFLGFLANQVGVNINKTDIERTFELYGNLVSGTMSHGMSYWGNSVREGINNAVLRAYRGVFGHN